MFHIVCPLALIGTPPLPLPQAGVSPRPRYQKGDTLACGWGGGGGGSQFGGLERKPSTINQITIKTTES